MAAKYTLAPVMNPLHTRRPAGIGDRSDGGLGVPGERPPRRRRALSLAAAALVVVGVWGGAVGRAHAAPTSSPSTVKAKAVAIVDQPTGRVLFLLHPDRRLAMASTTKIMTALVVLSGGVDLQRVVVVPALRLRWDETAVGLVAGQRLTVEQLLRAMLVGSANDAAVTLARTVGGGEPAFVARMNARARSLGLTNTHYENPEGMDAPTHYTSARDLTRLARIAMRDPRFAAYVRLRSTTLPKAKGKGRVRVRTTNTFMLARDWVYGVKTGYTNEAGSCLVAAGDYDGQRMIVTVLGEPDPATRNADLLKLFRYGATLYRPWSSPLAGSRQAALTVPFSPRRLHLVLQGSFAIGLPPGAVVSTAVDAPAGVGLPVHEGQVLGSVTYKVDGEARGSVNLVAARSIPQADWLTRLRYRLQRAWQKTGDVAGWASAAWHGLTGWLAGPSALASRSRF